MDFTKFGITPSVLFRYALASLGTWFAARGYFTNELWQTISGPILTIGTALYGVYFTKKVAGVSTTTLNSS